MLRKISTLKNGEIFITPLTKRTGIVTDKGPHDKMTGGFVEARLDNPDEDKEIHGGALVWVP